MLSGIAFVCGSLADVPPLEHVRGFLATTGTKANEGLRRSVGVARADSVCERSSCPLRCGTRGALDLSEPLKVRGLNAAETFQASPENRPFRQYQAESLCPL